MNWDYLSDDELIEWHDNHVLGGFGIVLILGGVSAGLLLSTTISDKLSTWLSLMLLGVSWLIGAYVKNKYKKWMAEMDVRNAKLQEEIDHLNAKLRDWND